MALFYFVRHGATAWNVEGRVCGSTDVPLSDLGRRQAQLLAKRLNSISVEAIYSSPLQRALETARLICEAMGREPVLDVRLTELNYGTWEGMTFEEIERATPALYRAWDENPADLAPPGGETGRATHPTRDAVSRRGGAKTSARDRNSGLPQNRLPAAGLPHHGCASCRVPAACPDGECSPEPFRNAGRKLACARAERHLASQRAIGDRAIGRLVISGFRLRHQVVPTPRRLNQQRLLRGLREFLTEDTETGSQRSRRKPFFSALSARTP